SGGSPPDIHLLPGSSTEGGPPFGRGFSRHRSQRKADAASLIIEEHIENIAPGSRLFDKKSRNGSV
ncbi:MAG: hypothetical protein WAV02_05600, partial [Stellaceae bacterium]